MAFFVQFYILADSLLPNSTMLYYGLIKERSEGRPRIGEFLK